jgi:adenosylcobinamide kinase/adenosylcobinamide-phosphate guanylyltransferase
MPLTLIGGGARSGKSSFALTYARRRGSRLAFIATAEPCDEEYRSRIERHRSDRPDIFKTFEEPLEIAPRVQALDGSFDAIVIDCLTFWVNSLMLANREPLEHEYSTLITAAHNSSGQVIFVTNEVGCGIVPENALARRFRDEAGRLNQMAATAASEVFWMAFGIPMQVKGSTRE